MPSGKHAHPLAALIARLRKDLDAPDLPVVIGELPLFDPTKQEATTKFNATLQELATTIPHVACVSAKDLKDRGDKLHCDAPSARTFGQRYAAAMLALQAPPAAAATPIVPTSAARP